VLNPEVNDRTADATIVSWMAMGVSLGGPLPWLEVVVLEGGGDRYGKPSSSKAQPGH